MISILLLARQIVGPSALRSVAIVAISAAVLNGTAQAQPFELVGSRARGMGGAFVAVADDATATWWNPAGLPATLVFDAVLDWNVGTFIPDGDRPIEEAGSPGKASALTLAATLPVAGLSYTRWQTAVVARAPAAPGDGSREDDRTAQSARSLRAHQFGVSLAQSLGDALVVGVTPKVIRGTVSVLPARGGTVDEILEAVGEQDGRSTTRADVDAGALLRLHRWRFGLAGRNLAAPEFEGDDGAGVRQSRRVRAGVAFAAEADRAGRQPWMVAFDADLTRDAEAPGGAWRGIAAGAERWFADRRVGVRAGVQASTAGQARTAATAGVSLAIPGGLWIETAVQAGGEQSRRGWGLTAHLMF